MTSSAPNQIVRRRNIVAKHRARLNAYEKLLIQAHLVLSALIGGASIKEEDGRLRELLWDIEHHIT